jgi:hypothetical protein
MLSDRTRAEMEAGARAVAERYADALTPEFLAAMKDKVREMGDRAAVLRTWERAGLVRIEETHYNNAKVRRLHWVKDKSFEETPETLMFGGYPSELLIANLALAITATGGDVG